MNSSLPLMMLLCICIGYSISLPLSRDPKYPSSSIAKRSLDPIGSSLIERRSAADYIGDELLDDEEYGGRSSPIEEINNSLPQKRKWICGVKTIGRRGKPKCRPK